jgi:hypothetical protein
MWYKTAKYGTLWDRLGPESEQEIDIILDESTIREKIIDPTTKTEKEVRKIDYKKLDQLLKKSVLGEKGVLNKIIEFHDPKYGSYGGIWLANEGSIPLIQTKILNIPILIRNYMNKVIHINPNSKYSYIQTKAIIKHEISHAISTAFLPQRSSNATVPEFYLGWNKLSKDDIGNNITETHYKIKFNSIRRAVFYDKLPTFEKFLSEKLGTNYIKEYFIESLDESTLQERAKKICELYSEFYNTLKQPFDGTLTLGGPRQKLTKLNKEEMAEIEKIGGETFWSSIRGEYYNDEQQEKIHNELASRSKLLGPGRDLYYANPEETRSHLAENKEYFSLSAVKEYYALQNYTTPKEENIPDFLNLIKTIFNQAVIHGESGNFYHINNYFDTLDLGDFFRSDIYYKRYDLKFQRQLAKILNENYQQIKTYFNNMLIKKEGE